MHRTTAAMISPWNHIARARSALACRRAASRRITLSSASTVRARSNLSAASPIERSMASRRALAVSWARTFTTSRDASAQSRYAASNADRCSRSASGFGTAVY